MANIQETFTQALQQHQAGRLQQSEKLCREVLKAQPEHPRALHLLGLIAHQIGKQGAAAKLTARAIKANPRVPRFYNTMGLIMQSLGRPQKAVLAFRRALQLKPDMPVVYRNLGNVLLRNGRLEPAANSFRQALKLKADYGPAQVSLGIALVEQGEVDAAIEAFEKALEMNKDNPSAHFGLSHALLKKQEFEKGWEEYEWRFKMRGWKTFYPFRYDAPLWDGSEFKDKRLLVHDEQGLGDTIQFLRLLPQVKERGGTVIFETRAPMMDLVQDIAGADEVITRSKDGKPEAEFDMYVPLLSLPGILGLNADNIPADVPYLHADDEKVEQWKEKISGDGLKVGLLYAGNPRHPSNRKRSCRLDDLKPLADVENVSLYGLQRADKAADEDTESGPALEMTNLGAELESMADTAAAIANLDLLITVDTAVAHLAGAMNKPVWVLTPFASDWRWMLEREDSPWYPSMRLFRQERPDDWEDAVKRIAGALAEFDAA